LQEATRVTFILLISQAAASRYFIGKKECYPLKTHKMKKNIGSLDRIIRFSAAAGAIAFIATNKIHGRAAYALGAAALMLGLTSSVGHCPAYAATHVSTNPDLPEAHQFNLAL
jgi:hypothetical protein